MKLTQYFPALAALIGFTLAGHAASVGPAGYFNDFSSPPAAGDISTAFIAGGANGAADATSPARMDTNIAAIAATGINGALAVSNANPPAASAPGVYSSAGYLQTRATGSRITLLMATLVNTTGSNVTRVTLGYNLASSGSGTEEVPGHRVYYSQTSVAGSWRNIESLSSAPPGPLSANLDINWNNGATLYVLWSDDNGTASPDIAYQIDNLSVTTSDPPLPLSVNLTAPVDGALFFAPETASVTLSATTGGTVQPTSVSFHTNGILAATVTGSGPYNAVLALPPGAYTLQATAMNGADPMASSGTPAIRVRPEYTSYSGGTHVENFISLGTAGTETPIGWYVGAGLPASTVTLTAGDGSAAPAGTILGWNYGNGLDPTNRALGTAATSADRNTVWKLRNNTESNLVSFELRYDGEVWRHHTSLAEALTNFVSYNLGGAWTRTSFDFVSPVAAQSPATALDGHASGNRVPDIGGVITPPAPVPPGGVIYIRWFNLNDADTDGGLALDNVSFRGTAYTSAGGVSIALSITTSANNHTVTWTDPGNAYKLQQSTEPGNALGWTDVPGNPASPYMQPLAGASHRFYRLKRKL